MNTTRHLRPATRRLAVVAAASAALAVAALAPPALGAPKPVDTGVTQHHDMDAGGTADCTDGLRELTTALREAGFSGQASHIAAVLTLHC